MLPNWFPLLLEARIQWELMLQAEQWGRAHTPAHAAHRENAFLAAEAAGYLMPGLSAPALVQQTPELVRAFLEGQERHQEHDKSAEHRAALTSCFANASPTDIYDALSRGETCAVEGYTLTPDQDGIWVTNPYGVDSSLWQTLTPERVVAFMTALACSHELGPSPA